MIIGRFPTRPMTSVRLPPVPKAAAAAPDLGAVRAAAERCGVSLYEDAYGTQSSLGSDPSVPRAASFVDGALAWLPGQSVLQLDGDDALRFLHSQTTNDVLQQPPGAARWHGYCSPKGRLLATMLAWRADASIRLLLPDSVAETIRRRLAMFVLRSKVRIANESGALVVLGLVGAAGADALARLQLAAPAPMKVAVADGASLPRSSGPGEPGAHPLTAIGLPPLPATAVDGAVADLPRWLLVAPVLVLVMVAIRMPALPAVFPGAIVGGLIATAAQGVSPASVLDLAYNGVKAETGVAAVDELLSRGGMSSMFGTIGIIFCAMCFGGVMEKSGMLGVIAAAILRLAHGTRGLITATVATCIGSNLVAPDQYLSIVVPGRMYREAYRKAGLHPKNLSRALEDSATITSPLVPWNSCGAFMFATLGVFPLAYAPYAFLNLINPLISILYGWTGWTITKLPPEEQEPAKPVV